MKTIFFIFFLNTFFLFSQTDFNKFDSNGKKHGVWRGFHPESKRIRYEGTFEHGKEVGVFNFYDDTKAQSIIATREFKNRDDSVYTIFYDQNKNKVSEGKQINRVYEGVWKYYHQGSKVIMCQENYKNGKLEGLRSVYYPSSKIAEESNYKSGIKNGMYKKYSEKESIVLEESHYVNGEYNGPTIFRDPLGNIVAEGNYVNGMKKGKWKFYENGKLVSEEILPKVNKVVKNKVK